MVKKLLIVCCICIAIINSAKAQVTKVQFVNNCADVALAQIDVWVGNVKLIPNLDFRTASIFVNVTANSPVTIAFAPANSLAITDTFYSRTTTFSTTSFYIVVINGLKNTAGYAAYKPIKADIFMGASENSTVIGNVDLLFANGVTDGTTYDFRTGLTTMGNDLAYGAFSTGYTSLPALDTKIRLTNTTGYIRYNTYEAPLATPFLISKACIVVASGFVNPSANNNGAAYGLWLAPPTGGPMMDLSIVAPEAIARVQFINNCADTTADTVDIYSGSTKIADDLKFRWATSFIEFMGNVPTTLGVAPRASTSSADAFYTVPMTFDSLGTHIVTANGIQAPAGYTPMVPFRLTKYNGAREKAAVSTNTDVLFMQGSTDAGIVTITGSGTWFSNIAFDNYSASYYSVPSNSYQLINSALSGTFFFGLSTAIDNIVGEAITLVNSGFKDSIKNNKGADMWLYYAKASGGPLVKLNKGIGGNVSTINKAQIPITLYPSPAANTLYIATKASIESVTICNMQGAVVAEDITVTNKQIDISKLAAGTYVLVLQHKEGYSTQKFIKQ